jgi:hypothetical protein
MVRGWRYFGDCLIPRFLVQIFNAVFRTHHFPPVWKHAQSQAKPSQAKPSQAKPSQAKPSQAKPTLHAKPKF